MSVSMCTSSETITKGFEPGKATMDFDAALSYASKNKLPIMLDFTGSDWCKWCKLMQKNIFAKDAWENWSKKNLIVVTIDFPNNKSIVPDKFKARNESLKNEFAIQGFPTYVLLDYDGATELGRTGAGTEKTLESFISEVSKILNISNTYLKNFSSKLSDKDRAEYLKQLNELINLRSYIADWKKSKAELKRDEALEKINTIINSYILSKMPKGELDLYLNRKKVLDSLNDEFNSWIGTNPPNTQENQDKYKNYLQKIDSAQQSVDQYLEKYKD